MPTFRYTAMTSAGGILTGEMDGQSAKSVIEHLQGIGHFPISAVAADARSWHHWLLGRWTATRRASHRDLGTATHELATLLHAGLPLDRALEILTGLGEMRRLRPHLREVLSRVRDGSSLADALAADGKTFPRLYVGLVRAGEVAGSLERTLYRLADYLTKTYAIREAVKSAMVYPTILLTTAGLALSVILVFVLPEFEPLFRSAGTSLPESTRIIAGFGRFIGGYWWLLLLSLAGVVAGIQHLLNRPAIRLRWDAILLRSPVLGALVAKIETERFARTLGTSLSDGIPLPVALNLTKDTLGNAVFSKAIANAATVVREGAPLAQLLANTRIFPSGALDFVRVGEETGRLEEMLLRQADMCEREIKHTLERLLALLVPGITIFLGFVVAGLITSLFAAILSINDLALH